MTGNLAVFDPMVRKHLFNLLHKVYTHQNILPGLGPKIRFIQGDKIETPTFIRENRLKIDYSFYITNQIMKPIQQLFSLVLKDLWTIQGKPSKVVQFQQDIQDLSRKADPTKLADKIEALKNKEVKALLFDDY